MTRKLPSGSENLARTPKALANLVKSDMRITGFSIEDSGVWIYTDSAKWQQRMNPTCGTFREDTAAAAISDYKDFVDRADGNNDPLVSLTYPQVAELAAKFDIMLDEPDLLESYELNPEQVEPVLELLATADADVRSFLIPMPLAVAEAALGEMENVVEIAESNHGREGSNETASWLRKARDGVKRIRAAIEEVTRVYSTT